MDENDVEAFMGNTIENFDFSQHDLNCMRESFKRCDLLIHDGCLAALMKFEDVLYVYYFSVTEKHRGRGMQFMRKIIQEYSPKIISLVTCHPAMVKISDRIAHEGRYRHTSDEKMVRMIVKKLEEDEGKISMELRGTDVVLSNFYGGYIPQRNRDFEFPEILSEGDALLVILEKEE